MNRFRVRLSSLCWLIAIVAAFLGGIRYGEYRSRPRGNVHAVQIRYSSAEDAKTKNYTAILLSP
jgi:hypothetical protein